MTIQLLKLFFLFAAVSARSTAQAQCGTTPIKPNVFWQRIVGGREAKAYSWPWQCYLVIDDNYECGGSVIGNNFILTAAHCLFTNDSDRIPEVFVACGIHNLTDPTWRTTAQLFRGESAVLHEKYDPNSDDYDIAVIRLPSPLTYNDKVQPVCIPSAPVADGTECVVTGWGDTQNPAEDNNVLRQVVVPIINLDTCRNLSEDYADLTQNMLCAGLIEGGKDACIGDSGGPLVCKQGDGWFQYGIVSYGFGCAEPNYPGVYADVFTLHPWIQEQTRKSAKEVVVNYDTSLGEYIMSMTIIEDAGPRDAKEIRKMLLGSRNVWKSTCQRIVPHVLEIEPTVDCRGEDWTVQHLSFKVMAVKWVEIYVDDQKVFSRIVGLYFTFSQEILTPGRKLKIVFYPKWRFPSLILFDVEIVFVCNEYQN